MSKPLLSICIPTYNRAEYLEKCLESIVKQEAFDGRVEIIISDNCSTDSTKQLCELYQSKYNNIHYYRNAENIQDRNFPLVLQRANGVLRKLTNDTIIYKPNAIGYILETIESNIIERPQLYFKNKGKGEISKVESLEEYINCIGFYITWIGAVALWEEDCDELDVMIENSNTKLGQVPMLIEHFKKHKKAVVYDTIIMSGGSPRPKNVGYGLYKVFYVNFLELMNRYVDNKDISLACYEKLRKDLLLKFFSKWIINYQFNDGEYIFSDENLKELVENQYKKEKYYYKYKIMLIYYAAVVGIRKLMYRIGCYYGVKQKNK